MTLDPIISLWILLPVLVALALFALWQLRAQRRAGAAAPLVLSWWLRLALVPLILLLALRPSIGGSTVGPSASGGLEVYFVVDTTSSMAAEDEEGTIQDATSPDGSRPATRLDAVKRDAAEIARSLEGAQFSLVTFDSSAVQRVPLTSDITALDSAVGAMTQEVTNYSSGSSIDGALDLMTTVLKPAQEQHPDRPRVLFYFGDGEQTRDSTPKSFAPLKPLLTGGGVLGYGTEAGGRMREFDALEEPVEGGPTYIQDSSANPPADAISHIDEATLGDIADQLGVAYTHRTAAASIAPVVAGIEVGPVSTPSSPPGTPAELYWIFAIPIALVLLREVLVILAALRKIRPAKGGVK